RQAAKDLEAMEASSSADEITVAPEATFASPARKMKDSIRPSRAEFLDPYIRRAISEDPDAAMSKLTEMVVSYGVDTYPSEVHRTIQSRGIPYTKKEPLRGKRKTSLESTENIDTETPTAHEVEDIQPNATPEPVATVPQVSKKLVEARKTRDMVKREFPDDAE